jgi:fatty acid desaturase
MNEQATSRSAASEPVAPAELLRLQRRSDAGGLLRLCGHFAAIFVTGALYSLLLRRGSLPLSLFAAIPFGFTLATMFAAMHETVHRTAFKSRALNDGVAWLAGLLSFYNSTFYRPYHGWHHRFTQLRGQDPELEDRKPTHWGSYLVELSGVPWWLGKARTYWALVRGRTEHYAFLNDETGPLVVRSVRWQLFSYAAAAAFSLAAGAPYFLSYWLVPLALGQPLLRAILLAEHTGCSETDDPLTNTRTTYTVFPIRFLMWEMPYHAEHHRYPALPFFALKRAHAGLGPHLTHVAQSYLDVHVALIKTFRAPAREPTP